ncbi:iron complex outermembrane receptor protein [Acetobacter aceti NBRC 14818]|nr:TonB-dependent receptor [Acetobacter aceti]TCS32692.1 iron complex outermembrane receptor protein [Acetobacter aceti NBRC 14818]
MESVLLFNMLNVNKKIFMYYFEKKFYRVSLCVGLASSFTLYSSCSLAGDIKIHRERSVSNGYAKNNKNNRTVLVDHIGGKRSQKKKTKSFAAIGSEEVHVSSVRHGAVGGGRMINLSTPSAMSVVDRAYITMRPPQGNILQIAQNMPGANVTAADPYGVTNNVNFTVRGLNSAEIGYLSDGTPQNDTTAGAIYPTQLVDVENLDQVRLSQGASSLDLPIFSALGGVLSYTTIDPSKKAGGYAEYMIGKYNAQKEFGRIQTGEIGKSGIRSWVSFSNFFDHHWNGPGIDHRKHIDAKALKEWGDGNRISAIFSWSDADLAQYYNPTMSDWKEKGNSNYYRATFNPSGSAADNASYWKNQRNEWMDVNAALPSSFTLTDHLKLNVLPYVWRGWGNVTYGSTVNPSGSYYGTTYMDGPGAIPYTDATGVAPVASRYVFLDSRAGITAKINYSWHNHDFVFGDWYEYDDNTNYVDMVPLGQTGDPVNIWKASRFALRYSNGTQLRALDWNLITQANSLFAGDKITFLNKKLTINVGIKVIMLDRFGANHLPGSQYAVGQNITEPLPEFSALYKFDRQNQLFFNVSTGMRAPLGQSFFNSYNLSTGDVSQKGTSNERPEYAIKEELGYRYQSNLFHASATLFNYDFKNRQVSTLENYNGDLISSTINVGSQTTRGVDVEVGTHPFWHFSPYANFEFVHAINDSNFLTQGCSNAGVCQSVALNTKGKYATQTPAYQASFGLSYNDGLFFGNFDLRYTGKQYTTFVNDEHMPSQLRGDIAVGANLPSFSYMKSPKIKLNFLNISDLHHLAGPASVTSNAHDVISKNSYVVKGSAPTYYLGYGFTMMATFSSSF